MTYRSNITDEEKFEHICNLTTSLVGLRKGSLSFKSRKKELQLPRLVAANIARLSNIHQRAIGQVFTIMKLYILQTIHLGKSIVRCLTLYIKLMKLLKK